MLSSYRSVIFASLLLWSSGIAAQTAIVVAPPVPVPDAPFTITLLDPEIAENTPTITVQGQVIEIEAYTDVACGGPPIPSPGILVVTFPGLPEGTYEIRYERVPSCGPRPEPQTPDVTITKTVNVSADAAPSLSPTPDPPVAHSAFTVDARWTTECPVTGVEVAAVSGAGLLRLTADMPCACPGSTSPVANQRIIAIDQRLDAGRYHLELLQGCTADVGSPTPPIGLVAEKAFWVAHEGGVVGFEVTPEQPSEDDEIVLHLSVPCLDTTSSFELDAIDSDVLRIAHRSGSDPQPTCAGATDPPRVFDVPIGRLPATTYAILVEQPDSDALSFAEVLEVAPGMSETLVLQGGRFEVRAEWATSRDNGTARARPLAGSLDAGAFWFFRPDNAEVLVKVLDGCSQNGHFWVFAAGLTNLAVDLTILDTLSGAERSYPSPLGTDFEPIQDTRAFDTCDVSTGGAS